MSELHYQLDLLKAMNQKLTEKERMYHTVFESAVGAFLYYSFERDRVQTLGQWKDFFDFEIREPREISRLIDAVDESYAMALRDVLYVEKTGQDSASVECRLKGTRTWLLFRSRIHYGEDGRLSDKVIDISNITKIRSQNEELTYMAYYDSITGLFSRNYFVRLLGDYVRTASETDHIVSVMMIDLDDFHKINDGQGMVVGDELIQQFGSVLKELCEEKDVTGCHLHTDVYLIAIYDPAGERTAENLHKEIQQRTRRPFKLSNGQELQITFSAGVAEYPEASRSAIELINCAEIMVFKSKSMGKNIIQYFNTPVLQEFLRTAELESKLKEAVFRHSFQMYYQPQYFAGNKKLRGMEALIRWKDGNKGMISPAVFIPIAEKNGAIIPIGQWVVEQSIRQYAQWRRQYGYPFIMSINISALQYGREDFVDSVIGLIKKYDIAPSEIELEITETILIEDFQAVYDKLMILRDFGIRISLDDFGTGFSSLSYLKKLPIDTLKIDKSFIDTVLTDSATRVITEAIINMVKALGIESVAEGVEEEKQYQYLYSIGCDVIQGYLFGRPLAAEDMETVLTSVL
ncbi:MAG: EAL domain-containing protein [Lachnospiraceae bacterium]|nr:EAL domain-containing protein [Butyrivibrio sp.]MCM1344949.1 EAL domain-containing protein [Muribaculaceae bacterium]MCM1412111.1 EAL domain-containing protein [Lachnospiraceae bacterium]